MLLTFNIAFLYLQHIKESFASRLSQNRLALFVIFVKNRLMDEIQDEEVLQEFGKRIQRCYGCFVSYYLKDMYLGDDVTFFCDYCKDNSMFHFNDFARLLDISKLREVADNDHHH